MHKAVATLAVAAGTLLAVPAIGHAEPAQEPGRVSPGKPISIGSVKGTATGLAPVAAGVPIDALASLAPAILGAAAHRAAEPAPVAPGAPANPVLDQLKKLLSDSALPDQLKTVLLAALKFLDGSGNNGGGGPKLPENGPVIAQFLYPTLGKGCISDTADSVGTALAVPGPAKLPPPGPAAGQAGFVFTALGTAPAADAQPIPLTVTWLNIDNGRTGTQNLTNAGKINPDGPATLSAIADTGPGRIAAVLGGSLTSQPKDAPPRTCAFTPTVGLFSVA